MESYESARRAEPDAQCGQELSLPRQSRNPVILGAIDDAMLARPANIRYDLG